MDIAVKNLRLRRLERHRIGGTRDRMELSYPVPKSPSGKVYQYSPNPDAAPRLFLIDEAPESRDITEELRQRCIRTPGPGQTVCPYSGHIANDDEFVHFDDIKAIKKQIGWDVAEDLGNWFGDWAKDFNRGQKRGGFITMKMEHKRKHRPRPLVIRQDLLRDLSCDICERTYAVYAIALFCPDCGAPNIASHFRREVELVSQQIQLADTQGDAGKPELAYRLMGNAHEDVLTAFETAVKTLYRYLVRKRLPEQAEMLCSKKAIGNTFQNIERTLAKFETLDIDPFSSLSANDLEALRLNIQKRHVIGHNLGLADEYYVELTQSEQPGETVALIGEEIRHFAELGLRIITEFESQLLPNANSSSSNSSEALRNDCDKGSR